MKQTLKSSTMKTTESTSISAQEIRTLIENKEFNPYINTKGGNTTPPPINDAYKYELFENADGTAVIKVVSNRGAFVVAVKNLNKNQESTSIKVDKSDYHVFQYSGGYYGITSSHHGGNNVHGGDSANEDDYNEEYMNDVFEQWDGELTHCGDDKYGEDGYTING